MATRNSRRLPHIPPLALVLLAGIVVLAADREFLTWLIAAGAFAAGRWALSHPGARAAGQPRRARPRDPAATRSSGDGGR